jgi:hypothetical protein
MDFAQVIKTVAPWIATAFTGPLGGLAVGAISDALGLPEKTVDAVKQAISGATPEQMLLLKAADQNFALQMQALGFKNESELAALEVEDRKSARDTMSSIRSSVPAVLSVLVTIGYFGVLLTLVFGTLKIADSQSLTLMLGSLTTAWASVMSFWFGTTFNSARKTELIAQSPAIEVQQ